MKRKNFFYGLFIIFSSTLSMASASNETLEESHCKYNSCWSCESGWRGLGCRVACPSYCADRCTKKEGFCINGCRDPEKEGPKCDNDQQGLCNTTRGSSCASCPPGKYGTHCQLDCQNLCSDGTCRQSTGTCASADKDLLKKEAIGSLVNTIEGSAGVAVAASLCSVFVSCIGLPLPGLFIGGISIGSQLVNLVAGSIAAIELESNQEEFERLEFVGVDTDTFKDGYYVTLAGLGVLIGSAGHDMFCQSRDGRNVWIVQGAIVAGVIAFLGDILQLGSF